jgi:hypothetical protein
LPVRRVQVAAKSGVDDLDASIMAFAPLRDKA